MRRMITITLSTIFALLLVLAVVGGGCGGDDNGGGGICDQACANLEKCSPGSTCTVSGSGNAKVCECMAKADCNAIAACLLP